MKKRNIIFRVSEDEILKIKQLTDENGFSSVSEYLRVVSMTGYVMKIDTSELNKFKNEISAIGRNINQIAKVGNRTKSISKDDIKQLQVFIAQIEQIYKDVKDKLVVVRGYYGN